MKTQKNKFLGFALALLAGVSSTFAQGTVFTYQGWLDSGGAPFTGVVEFVPSLWDAASDGSLVATNDSGSLIVGVTNGLFAMPLDFGASFPGAARWLQLEVRTNTEPFTVLTPRQRITPTPYAITASNVTGRISASQLTGTLPPDLFSGNYSGTFNFNNPSNAFSGNGAGLTSLNASNLTGVLPSASLSGIYSSPLTFNNPSNVLVGNGAGLTSLNASQLTSGTVPDARLDANVARTSQVWMLGGNAGTTPGTHFVGTSDNQPLELRVNNQPALRLESGAGNSVNIIGGWIGNSVAPGLAGATVGGGGAGDYFGSTYSNRVEGDFGTVSGGALNTARAAFSFIGGGVGNTLESGATFGAIAGGYYNSVNAYSSFVGGGYVNAIQSNALYSTIGGGFDNNVETAAQFGTIAGGRSNRIQTNALHVAIGGGHNNAIQPNAQFSTIGGGGVNTIQRGAVSATIAGGYQNVIGTNSFDATISGGYLNRIETNTTRSTIGGGSGNLIEGQADYGVIGGGAANNIEFGADVSTVSGGENNVIQYDADRATIGGGSANVVRTNADYTIIAGGRANAIEATAHYASIGGGRNNIVETNSLSGTISGGAENRIESNSFSVSVGGGYRNTIGPSASDSAIGGGRNNTVKTNSPGSTISGGAENRIEPNSFSGSIGGGFRNAIGPSATDSAIGGGNSNVIETNASYSAIGGGLFNSIGSASYSATVSGGQRNTVTGSAGTIPGGLWNRATDFAFAAGRRAKADHTGSFVWADSIDGDFASTADNQFNVRALGGVRLQTGGAGVILDGQPLLTMSGNASQLTGLNASQLTSGTVPNGRLGGTYSAAVSFNNAGNTFAGAFSGSGTGLTLLNASQLASGTVPDARLSANVALLNGVQQFSGAKSFSSAPSFTAAGEPFTVSSTNKVASLNADLLDGLDSGDFALAGHNHDSAYARLGGNALGATLTLGTTDDQPVEFVLNGRSAFRLEPNASGAPNIIGGAFINVTGAGVVGATIAGGGAADHGGIAYINAVSANFGTIGGGMANTIETDAALAAIGGGCSNTVQGKAISAAIGGGFQNTIQANGECATIPGGLNNTATDFAFAAGNQAKANHTGAFVWGDSTVADIASTNANSVTMRAAGGYRLFSNSGASAGVYLAAGSGSWTSMSDRNAKENLAPVDAQAVLDKVATLPLTTWNYKSQDATVRHLGPMAQDFKAAFGLGETETGITTVDADGVALAAIQGLNQKLEQENARLREELEQIKRVVRKLAGE